MKLEPSNPVVWAAAVGFYVRGNRQDDARQLLLAAQKEVPAAQMSCLLAQGWELLGNTAEAEKQWERLLASGTEVERCDHAAEFYVRTKQQERLRQLLDAIASGKQPATETATAWCDAIWLGYSPGKRGRPPESGCADRPGPFGSQRPAAGPAAQGGTADFLGRSCGTPPGVGASGNRPGGRLCAGCPKANSRWRKRYFDEGDLLRARNHLVDLVVYFPEEPRYLALLIRVLLQRKENSLAESLLRRMQRVAPQDFLTVRAEAELAFSQGQFAAIPPLFHRYIEQVDSKVPHPILLQDQPALALQELAERAGDLGQEAASAQLAKAAETIRQESVARQPAAALALAAKLAQQGDFDTALDWLERTPLEVDSQTLSVTEFRLMALVKASRTANGWRNSCWTAWTNEDARHRC